MAKRRTYCTNLDAELMKEIRVLSAQQVKRQNDLLEEAIKDLLKKYQHIEPSLGVSMTEEF
jgi:flagellar biosynthesis chaperone FliJ